MLNDYLTFEVLYNFIEKIYSMQSIENNVFHLKNKIYTLLGNCREPFFFTCQSDDFSLQEIIDNFFHDFLNILKMMNNQQIKHYIFVLNLCINPVNNNYFNNNCLLMYFNYKSSNHIKICNLQQEIYYVFFYVVNTICNLLRASHGYYFSCAKNEFIIMNNMKNYKKKILRQYNKCFLLMDEFEDYVNNFFEFWVKYTMNSMYGNKFFFNFKQLFHMNFDLEKDVNKKYRFLKYEYKSNNIKIKKLKINNNLELYEYSCLTHNFYSIFYNYLLIYCPETTDEYGIPYDINYIPLPLL